MSLSLTSNHSAFPTIPASDAIVAVTKRLGNLSILLDFVEFPFQQFLKGSVS